MDFVSKEISLFFNGPTLTPKEGEKVEAVTDFIFLVSKITADSDCSHETKRPLLLGKKVIRNLDSFFKSEDITLLTEVCIVKAVFFSVVMDGCERFSLHGLLISKLHITQEMLYSEILFQDT